MRTAARRAFATALAFGLIAACSGGEDAAGGRGGDHGAAGTAGMPETGGAGGTTQSFDRSNISFVDNLLVKVAAGEWTLGEGLVASLQLMAGEIDALSVLRGPELLNYEGTGIVAMAYDYLDGGPDADAKTKISRLLDLVVLSSERLEAMAGLGSQSPSVRGASIGLKDSTEDCRNFFYEEHPPLGVGECLEVRSVTISGTKYRLFSPAPPLPTAGWMEQHYERAIEALNDTVPIYKGFGSLPPANLVFSATDTPYSAQAHPELGGSCGVVIYKSMQSETDGDFRQTLAHELAHCFQTETFVEQNKVDYDLRKWREEGLAEYLSNVVYPNNNLEWVWLPALQNWELDTTIFDRAYTNSIFFQYLAQRLGNTGVFAIVETLPGGGLGTGLDQQVALATYPNMDAIYHDFAKAMTDGEVMDTGGAAVPYQISELNQPTIEVTEPHRYIYEMEPFRVHRSRILVQSSKEADITFEDEGEIRDSSRPTNELDWGALPTKIQGDQCDPGVVLVVTTIKSNGGFDLDFHDVRDLPASTEGGQVACSIEGAWVVDNGSIDISPMAFELDYVRGEVRITFRGDGTAEVAYINFEYRVHDDDTITMLGETVRSHEEITFTTNAQGITTYEVDGNEIAFGHIFESEYLQGTRTVHHTKTYDPPNSLGPDIDETYAEDPEGLYLFSGYVDFDIQSGGRVLQLRFGDRVQARLDRVGPESP